MEGIEYHKAEKAVPATMSIEPEEIAEARKLLEEFERTPELLKKSSFSEGIRILNDFLTEHPNSEFSQRANNLINVYTKLLIKRLGTMPFSNLSDWVKAFMWVFTQFSDGERKKFATDPELKNHWDNFFDNTSYLKFK